MITSHTPVLIAEMLHYLSPHDGEHILDCTFGGGGYSKAILHSCNCRVTGVDQDQTVEPYADEIARKYASKFQFINSSFAESCKYLQGLKFDGIVMDLGVSSMQLDCGERGFSFTHDGPLDMRMNATGITAADFINNADEEEIANVIYRYGEETAARKIARKIVAERRISPILTTSKLAAIVRSCLGFRKGKIDPATKSFQAIRIHINDELGQLERFLSRVADMLITGGRLVIVSFHSLEDSMVKNFFKANAAKVIARSKYAKEPVQLEAGKWLKVLTKKPVSPARQEVQLNPRSRSAKLRAAVKISEGN